MLKLGNRLNRLSKEEEEEVALILPTKVNKVDLNHKAMVLALEMETLMVKLGTLHRLL